MKKQVVLVILFIICLLQQGCVVLSFYPLYTSSDLILNSQIEGKWSDDETGTWEIKKLSKDKNFNPKDYTSKELAKLKKTYVLYIYTNGKKKPSSVFHLHLLKIGTDIYADFYPIEWDYNDDVMLLSNVISAHSFAKIKVGKTLEIKWFDGEWLDTLIKRNKIRIRHENNGQNIILTAKAKELQKFVLKYGNHVKAYGETMQFRKRK